MTGSKLLFDSPRLPLALMYSKPKKPRLDDDELQDMIRIGVSENALSKIYQKLRDREPVSKSTVSRHIHKVLTDARNLFVPVPLTPAANDADPVFTFVANIPAMLQYYCQESDRYKRIFAETVTRSQGTLTVLLYHDDIQSGNILAPTAAKKSNMAYFNFLELPKKYLKSPFSWLPLGFLSHNECVRVAAGLSAYYRKMLETILLPQCKEGFYVQDLHCRLRFGYLVADFDAQRATMMSRGSAALRVCIHCANCLKKNSNLKSRDFKEIDEPHLQAFVHVEDVPFFEHCDRLEHVAKNSTKKEYEDYALRLGMNYHPEGLCWDRKLRDHCGPSKLVPDVMHCYYAQGIANLEASLFYSVLCDKNITLEMLQEAAEKIDWQRGVWNSASATFRKNLFHEKKMEKELYKGEAWETEIMLPLLAFVAKQLLGAAAVDKELRSLECCCSLEGNCVAFYLFRATPLF